MDKTDRIIQKILFILILCCLGIIIYSNTLRSPFQFDDWGYIDMNYVIRSVKTVNISNMPKLLWQNLQGHWHYQKRLVAFYSFALNYYFHQDDVIGYHCVNILIHILNSLLVWWFISLILSSYLIAQNKNQEEGVVRYKESISFLIGLLFLVHPIQTQAVTYISQRFTSLATFFYLLSLCLYIKGRLDFSYLQKRVWTICFFLGVAISGVLGMFTKEIVFTLPFCIFLIELYFFKGERGKLFWGCMVGVFMFALLIPVFYLSRSSQLQRIFLQYVGDGLDSGGYLLTQFRVIVTYIRLLFLPIGQNLDYDFPVSQSLFELPTLLSFIFLLAIVVAALKIFHKYVFISFGILWFFLTLSVESSIIPIKHVIAEHRLYLPSVGFCLVLCIGFYHVVKDFKKVIIILSVVVLTFSYMTFQRNKIWRTEVAMWEDVIKKSPNKANPNLNLGRAYYFEGKYELALTYFNKALKIDPYYTKVYNNRALIYQQRGQYDKALEDFDTVSEISPSAATYYNKGRLYIQIKQYEEALDEFNNAIETNPVYANAYNGRGTAHEYMGEYTEALYDFNKALELDPNLKIVYYQKGRLNFKLKRYDSALADLNKMLETNPNFAFAYFYRSLVYKAMGDIQRALNDALKAKNLGHKVKAAYIQHLKSLIDKD